MEPTMCAAIRLAFSSGALTGLVLSLGWLAASMPQTSAVSPAFETRTATVLMFDV
jgi:hypothetical protein